MSRKISSVPPKKVASPEKPWPAKIRQLQQAKGLSRAALARAVGVTPGAALLWDQGRAEPSAETYLRLGNLAGDDLDKKLWFWERAGLSREEVTKLVPSVRKRIAEAAAPAGGKVRVRILKHTRYTSQPALAPESEVESVIELPAEFVPEPGATCGLRAPRDLALFAEGDVVFVDSTIDPEKLMAGGELVVVEDGSGLLLTGWLEALPERREPRLALIITVPQKVNTPVGQQIVLQPRVMASRQAGGAPFSREPGSPHLLGRVIGFLRAPRG